MKPIYIAAYHQSPFGKLFDMSVPQIIERAVTGCVGEIGASPADIDVAAAASACNSSLNEQGLLAGLVAMVPGLEGKPIEAVENACASGGQAVLSTIHKLQLGLGDVGIAVGYEKMRDAQGKMDGKLIGKVLGYFSHPDDREGKVFVFPHIFAEVMALYMEAHGVSARELGAIAVTEYANARHNPYAQMRDVQCTLDTVEKIEGINRFIVEGLPLKTYDCSQITDGYASLLLATEIGLARLGLSPRQCVRVAGFAQATDPLKTAGRDLLRPAGAYRAMHAAY
jgi:acetyl-CoA C-acetyltransferase